MVASLKRPPDRGRYRPSLRPTSRTAPSATYTIRTTAASQARRRDVSAETSTRRGRPPESAGQTFPSCHPRRGVHVQHHLVAVAGGPAVEVRCQRRLGQQTEGIGPALRRRDVLRQALAFDTSRLPAQPIGGGLERALDHGADFGRQAATDHDHAVVVHPGREVPMEVPRLGLRRAATWSTRRQAPTRRSTWAAVPAWATSAARPRSPVSRCGSALAPWRRRSPRAASWRSRVVASPACGRRGPSRGLRPRRCRCASAASAHRRRSRCHPVRCRTRAASTSELVGGGMSRAASAAISSPSVVGRRGGRKAGRRVTCARAVTGESARVAVVIPHPRIAGFCRVRSAAEGPEPDARSIIAVGPTARSRSRRSAMPVRAVIVQPGRDISRSRLKTCQVAQRRCGPGRPDETLATYRLPTRSSRLAVRLTAASAVCSSLVP